MKFQPWSSLRLALLAWMLAAPALAAQVTQLEVRVRLGGTELIAGSSLELRIYEIGRSPRQLQLVHGESWPRDSSHAVPLRLSEPLDPRNVVRFALRYRSPVAAAGELDIVSAEVDVRSSSGALQPLLDANLSGVVARQGELATQEREAAALTCRTDADCDDQRSCDGVERCAPRTAGADARGCVKGTPLVCPVNQVCSERGGCRGIDVPAPPGSSPQP